MSILEYFSRSQPPIEEEKVPPLENGQASAEGHVSSDEEPQEEPQRKPKERSKRPHQSFSNREKAEVVKWCLDNNETATEAAREFNYKPRLV